MNYELAKKLKDAGFPQGTGTFTCPPNADTSGSAGYTGPRCYVPSLSELIEACGNRFCSLERVMPYWFAKAWYPNHKDVLVQDGSTPEEAVANLWLALKQQIK